MANDERRTGQRKSPADRHEEMLGCAVDLSRREGLVGVTLHAVASGLGVTRGLVSHYFTTADQLVTETFRAAARADLDAVFSVVDAGTSPTRQLTAVVERVLDESSAEANTLWLDAWSLGRRNESLAAELATMTGEWVDRLTAIAQRGVDSGDFAVQDARQSATRLLLLLDGLGAQRVIRSTDPRELLRIAHDYARLEFRPAR